MANEKLIKFSEVKKKLTAIRQYFSGYPSTDQDKLARAVVKMCMEEVDKLKPVDAAPVVHGRWEPHMEEIEDGFGKMHLIQTGVMCSECNDYSCCGGNYCKNCGAKMDRERISDG